MAEFAWMGRLAGASVALLVACTLACASAVAASSPLQGAYQVHVGGSGPLSGTWRLAFSASGAYTVSKKPNTSAVLIAGTSTVSGHKIVLVDRSGPASCTGSSAKGTYSWTLAGKRLKLHVVKDTCGGRPEVLASSAWTRVG